MRRAIQGFEKISGRSSELPTQTLREKERSAMVVQAAQETGVSAGRHIQGAVEAWRKVGGTLA